MLGAALSIGVLLALTGGGAAGTAPQGCTIPPQELARLLERLEGSVATAELPNPSVLLALNLAGAAGSNARQQLLKQLEEEAVKRAQKDMSSGEVALYTLALLSSCHSPQQVEALGLGVDLLRILQQKTDEEVASLDEEGVPLSTLYSVGLDVLALCVAGTGSYERAAIILAKQLLSPQSHLSVDTEAVVALALVCVHGRTELDAWEVRDLLEAAVEVVAVSFLYKQTEGNGLIGNVYSTGLAMQLLVAASEFYSPWEWDCAQAFSAVGSHNLQQPMAIAQALPALVGSSYLDAASLDCSTGAATATSVQLSLSPSTMTAQE
ncbi:IF factor, partial [Chauna torquata]|nr:IF factor [Chauna torquata]